ncbi:unnamed protein product [Ilex paraguariensis]|uniref:Uncharacterized protein n=1 Tax=Ilex paraguariensis TaxID=185542 RepID=A0ABC8S5C5_9AQUA
MAIESVLHMNGGSGESSYANNSSFQKSVLLKTKPVIEDSIKDMYINGGLPECLKIADLGCSSDPNTLFLVSEIIDIFHGLCKQHSHRAPEFQVFLNDLPENDFNSIFNSLSFYFDKLKKEKGDLFGPTFILAMPGSFYQRLFPRKSLDFVHSSYSVHWLSQVPEGLENNKRNIYMSKTSPPDVLEAYSKQFQRTSSPLYT